MFIVDDDIHCELIGEFRTFEDAKSFLEKTAELSWDDRPNRAPCVDWKRCGRKYVIYDDGGVSSYLLNTPTPILNVNAEGIEWIES